MAIDQLINEIGFQTNLHVCQPPPQIDIQTEACLRPRITKELQYKCKENVLGVDYFESEMR